MPGWLPFLNLWDIASIFAYTQAFALLESALVLFLLIVLCVVLPARFFRDKFAAQGSMVVLMAALWTAVFLSVSAEIRFWSLGEFLFWSALSLAAIVAPCILIYRSRRIERAISAFAGRLAVLLYVYVPLSCLSLIIVIVRNVR
jgi:hypothetical protein